MNQRRFFRGWPHLIEDAVCVACAVYLTVYILIALRRVTYPFDLEWMEGASVDHVRRLMAGQGIYVRPTLNLVPFLYSPLYYYVSAAVAEATGMGVLPLRMVSFVCSLGCFAVLYQLVFEETGSWRAGLVAAGTFAGTYRIGGAWFDIARVDSLFLLLALAALYLVRFGRSTVSWAVAGALPALSALTKQTALLIAGPVIVYAVVTDRRRGLALAGACAIVWGGATWMLNFASHGWYLYYVIGLPARIQSVASQTASFWTKDLFAAVPAAVSVTAAYLITRIAQGHRPAMFYAMLSVALVGSAWISRLHSGAFDNVLIPAYACLSIVFGLGFHELSGLARAGARVFLRPLVAAVCLLQLAALWYRPSAQVPTSQDRALQRRLLQRIADADGEVYVAQHGYFPLLGGKRPHAHSWAMLDILRAGSAEDQQQLADEIHGALAAQRFRLIVLDRLDPWLEPELHQFYHRVGSVFDEDGLWTRTGYRTRPTWVYAPN